MSTTTDLTGRRAIVTGGTRGIGRAIAHALHDAGARVGVHGRDADTLADVAAELDGPWAVADVADRGALTAALDTLADALGGVDVVVANAGATARVAVDSDPEEAERAFDDVVAANLKGAYLTAAWAAPRLPRPGGRIVTLSSIAAYKGGAGGGALAYAAAKAGVLGLTRALATELAADGITANAIAPGYIGGTDFFGPGGDPERDRTLSADIPAGRPGTPDEIAATAVHLASPAAAYLTGQVVHVNGGWYIGG